MVTWYRVFFYMTSGSFLPMFEVSSINDDVVRSAQQGDREAFRSLVIQYIDRKPFGVSYEIAPSPFNEGRHLLRIGVATTPNARAKSWNLVFLVDVSGSMADTMKLDLIKRSLRGLVDKMKEGDTVAIVTYAGDARVALQPTSRSELDKILIAINSLSAGGGTNGADGIRTAYQLAHSNMKQGSVNRVILATDGDFNILTF
jgi:Ca-activated chloride channel family protein